MAFSGYEVVSKDIEIDPGHAFPRVTLSCPPGKKPFGAGWRQVDFPLERLELWESGPTDDNTGWTFSAVNFGDQKITVHLYVTCAAVNG